MSTLEVLIFFIFLYQVSASRNEGASLLEKIKNGLKSMKSYLDTVKGIANLVSNGFKKKSDQKPCFNDKNSDETKKPESSNLASAFFRLLGLDSPKIAAITVNSAIFLAQMVGLLFGLKPDTGRSGESEKDSKDEKDFDPYKFFMDSKNQRIQELIRQAKNPDLPSQVINGIDDFDTACIRLLMCKSTPVILHAQKSLKNKTIKRFDLTSWLPSKDIFEENAEQCEKKYSDCKIFPEESLDD